MMHVVKVDAFVDKYLMIVNHTNVFGQMKQYVQAKAVRSLQLHYQTQSQQQWK